MDKKKRIIVEIKPIPEPIEPPKSEPKKFEEIEVGIKSYSMSVSAEQFTGINLDLLLFKVGVSPGAFIDFLTKGSFTVKIYEDKMVWRKS